MDANCWLRTARCISLVFLCIFLLIVFGAGCKPGGTPSATQVGGMETTQARAETPTSSVTKAPVPSSTPVPAASPTSSAPSLDAANLGFVPVYLDQQAVQVVMKEKKELPPEDILKEVTYSGGYGGMGDCSSSDSPITGPTLLADKEGYQIEWGNKVRFFVCGWQPGEKITYRIISPKGETIYEEVLDTNDDGRTWWDGYEAELNTPPGEYTLTFAGKKETLEQKVTVLLPASPRLYRKDKTLYLYAFQPNERAKLFIYYEPITNPKYLTAELFGWEDIQVNKDGQAVIQLDNSALVEKNEGFTNISVWYVVVGEASGEVQQGAPGTSGLDQKIFSPYGFVISSNVNPEGIQPKNIWDLIKYQELYSPGKKTYSLSIAPTDAIRWRFAWCAVDKKKLNEILPEINVEYWVDDQKIDPSLINEQVFTSNNGWECKRWSSLLSNWKSGAAHTLDIRYQIKDTISDGASTYYAGDYQQVINVKVK
jgi:hypothetical protein